MGRARRKPTAADLVALLIAGLALLGFVGGAGALFVYALIAGFVGG